MTQHAGPTRHELLTAGLEPVRPIDRVQMTSVELAPGQAAGAHHHPCDVVGIVLSGRIRFHIDGHREAVLHAGDPFFEPKNTYVLHFDNDSHDQPAVFLACYLLTPGNSELIRMTPPPADEDDG